MYKRLEMHCFCWIPPNRALGNPKPTLWGNRYGESKTNSAHPARVGNLHYAAIDMGGSITISAKLQKEFGPERKQGENPCVIAHLSAVFDRKGQNFPRRGSIRLRTDSLRSQVRHTEYQQ